MTNTANILQPFPSLKLKPKFLIHETEMLRSELLYFYIEAYDLPLTALYMQRSTVQLLDSVCKCRAITGNIALITHEASLQSISVLCRSHVFLRVIHYGAIIL